MYALFSLKIKSPSAIVLRFQGCTRNPLEDLLKDRLLDPHPEFQTQQVGVSLMAHISSKFPDAAAGAGTPS